MKIKTKLTLGFGFLFLAVVLIWLLGAVYINKLVNQSKDVIKDNYKSVETAKNMFQILDEIKNIQTTFYFSQEHIIDLNQYKEKNTSFLKYLSTEESNITEVGEKEETQQLRTSYSNFTSLFQKHLKDSIIDQYPFFIELLPAYNDVKNGIIRISDINMEAIARKSSITQDSANNAFMYISLIGTTLFLISFSLFFNFPSYIANPIKELTDGIKEIANKNYDQRLTFKSNDEFGELATAFNSMAKRLDNYEHSNLASVMFEKKRIETIINNMKDPIFVLDENYVILSLNKVANEIIGLKENELVGKYATEIATKNDLLHNIIKDFFIDKENTHQEMSHLMKIYLDGKESFFSKEIIKVFITSPGQYKGEKLDEKYDEEQLIGYVIVLKNVTKYQELDAAKTNFIATISHELKTPIASLKMSLKLIEDPRIGEINNEQKQLINNMKEEAERLLNITSELLDITQVETGTIHLNIKPASPERIILHAYNAMKIHAEQKNVAMELSLLENLPDVSADVDKTVWVLINLMTNALRHSEPGNEIRIEVKKQEDNILFVVQDFGPGIDPVYLDKIFNRFFMVPGSDKSGTGLGLSISKEFIVEQKGRIWVESELGKGSKFNFTLPIYVA